MLRHAVRGRSGITLTEILISILIMGIGLISLATLFPLGLLRLREAQRSSRSSYLTDSAAADLEARGLLSKQTFLNPLFSPWNTSTTTNPFPFTLIPYDPWVQDTGAYATTADPTTGVYRGVPLPPVAAAGFGPVPGPGLPVAYDPLWRYQANQTPVAGSLLPTGIYIGSDVRLPEARFASGLGFLRNDPNPGGSSNLPSAHGLQRLTNFNPFITYPHRAPYTAASFATNTVPEIFVSPEDIVLQSDTEVQATSSTPWAATIDNASPIIPDMSAGAPVSDWRFSWMFTGHQADATNGTVFTGDIVIWENRPFGINRQLNINGAQQWVVDGETVVEGVFGFGSRPLALTTGATVGFGSPSDRVVLLRWPSTMPDPDVKVGGWIADVTYERRLDTQASRAVTLDFPYQRCHWYQIVKRTQPAPHAFTSDPGSPTFRAMTVWVGSDLKARTLRNISNGEPFHVNAALIAPNVVNVYPKVIYSR